ncbi:unnamed protein product [Sphenostylis stenocarpa]|uniref:DNA-directed RNA polymerase n=1 Tax=Sphenostylis stenocarpa TaxID=92480 RepID=A0AA86V9H1_9FABA|nr:unnamed protein product [Sphenostylis stenocarpa]
MFPPPNPLAKGLDSLPTTLLSQPTLSAISSNMWRHVAKQACRGVRINFHSPRLLSPSHASLFSPKTKVLSNLPQLYCVGSDRFRFPFCAKGYSGVAEAVSSTDMEEDGTAVDEIQQLLLQEMNEEERSALEEEEAAPANEIQQQLLQEMDKEEKSELVGEEAAPMDGIRELLQGMKKEKQKEVVGHRWQNHAKGVGQSRYQELRRRQVKIETEVWEEAAKEYRELLMDMCEQKLAPNLPYMKSLFLGWFEPLRDVIAKEQEMYNAGRNRTAYAPYFVQLPADKMAVIAMHKLMGLLMTGNEHATIGTARVVQAACGIGDAIENEVRIYKFLEKTKKKKGDRSKKSKAGESVDDIKEEQKLRKKVIDLMKKQKLVAVRGLVKGQDDIKPWGTVIKTKVCVGSRLIELLMQTAYIQPPSDQYLDDAPDIRPAFVHSFRTVVKESINSSRKYGIIQCDPLILKGLDRTAIEPLVWKGDLCRSITVEASKLYLYLQTYKCSSLLSHRRISLQGGGKKYGHSLYAYVDSTSQLDRELGGPTSNQIRLGPWLSFVKGILYAYCKSAIYDKGGHLFLPSYVMRTHGVRQQREAIKRAPRKQLEPVFEALDTLGHTKWRVNKKVLSVVDRIWASGGRLADLVDRDDVPLPDEPDTDDEAKIKKWKWKVKSVRKENRERYSQRCDIELKLAVARKMKDEEGFYYPHNVDFRGRAYPMHPHLNHLGSDLCRGVLEFADGRPLGKSGLQWLKIHLANLYAGGVDKLSHEGRLVFTENHFEDIFDSADKPLEGRRWWLKAEDPLQCLAVCITLTEALKSPSPETFISHIPVHQDGSCNGLQHYAALGRDKRIENESVFLGVAENLQITSLYICTGWLTFTVKFAASWGFVQNSLVKSSTGLNICSCYPVLLYEQRCVLITCSLGAVAVNLVAGEKPADVYSGIAARFKQLQAHANFLAFLLGVLELSEDKRRQCLSTLFYAFAMENVLVSNIMHQDAQKDPAIFPDALHARTLVNQVDRKLVKQTVMTSVYGVTYIGAREQIKRRLEERNVISDDTELFGASCYTAKVTLTALEEMFQGARGIMSWLGDCAKIIASENQPVRWTTPLGLPVVQPYHKLGKHVKDKLHAAICDSSGGRLHIMHIGPKIRSELPVMVRRQRTAFPPNFVHSLDGSHMMMTAVACKKEGLNFAGISLISPFCSPFFSRGPLLGNRICPATKLVPGVKKRRDFLPDRDGWVHDSYWTHACDVDKMNRILREKFVELYETPVLENPSLRLELCYVCGLLTIPIIGANSMATYIFKGIQSLEEYLCVVRKREVRICLTLLTAFNRSHLGTLTTEKFTNPSFKIMASKQRLHSFQRTVACRMSWVSFGSNCFAINQNRNGAASMIQTSTSTKNMLQAFDKGYQSTESVRHYILQKCFSPGHVIRQLNLSV